MASSDEDGNVYHKQPDGKRVLDTIKKLCKDIEMTDKKIDMYRFIINNK